MSGSYAVVMGDRGRLVIPAEARASARWEQGTRLLLVESTTGMLLLTVDQARTVLSEQGKGRDLVAELLAERRAEALAEAES